jgi:hypothetical protein
MLQRPAPEPPSATSAQPPLLGTLPLPPVTSAAGPTARPAASRSRPCSAAVTGAPPPFKPETPSQRGSDRDPAEGAAPAAWQPFVGVAADAGPAGVAAALALIGIALSNRDLARVLVRKTQLVAAVLALLGPNVPDQSTGASPGSAAERGMPACCTSSGRCTSLCMMLMCLMMMAVCDLASCGITEGAGHDRVVFLFLSLLFLLFAGHGIIRGARPPGWFAGGGAVWLWRWQPPGAVAVTSLRILGKALAQVDEATVAELTSDGRLAARLLACAAAGQPAAVVAGALELLAAACTRQPSFAAELANGDVM